MKVPFFRPGLSEDEIAEVVNCLRSGWLTTGPRVKASYPDSRRRSDSKSGAAGDVPVLLLNTTLLKDAVSTDVWRDTPGPGFYHFPKWLPTSFFDELTAEKRGAKGWDRTGRRANETFDLCVYGHAAALFLGAEKINWLAPPPWADEWEKNPDVRADDAPPPAPIQRRTRGNRSSGVSVY
mgnify:CR=1 FL=1